MKVSIRIVKTTLAIVLIVIFFLLSCEKKDERLVDHKTFVKITAELMIIEKLALNAQQKALLAKDVFEKYHINIENYRYTRDHYKNDPAYWAETYKQIQAAIREFLNKHQSLKKSSH